MIGVRASIACLGLLATYGLSVSTAEATEAPIPATNAKAASPQPAIVTEPPWRWDLRALVQIDWIVHRQSSLNAIDTSSGLALNDDRFLLRRARLRASGEREYLGGWLELDANTVAGPQVQPFEAGLITGWPTGFAAQRQQVSQGSDLARATHVSPSHSGTDGAVSLAAGLLRIPFGFDGQEPLTRRPWLERGRFSTALFGQARDLGVSLSAAYDVVRLEVAINNGSPLGTPQYAAIDPERGKDWTGRLGIDWPIADQLRVEAGWSWLTGKALSPGTAATKDTVVWVDDNENGLVEVVELSPAPGNPATPSSTFHHYALGLDARATWTTSNVGSLQLRAEVVRAVNLDRTVEPADPMRLGRDVRELGLILGARYELWQLLSVGVRYDLYDPDADATRREVATVVPSNRSYRTLALSLGVRRWGGRFLCQYDFEKNALGRDPSGRPTTLLDNRLTARAELTFP